MGSVLLTILVLCLVVVYWMCLYDTNRFTVTEYTFEDDRIRRKCRAVVLADLHNKQYGLNNQNLLDRIRELEPDLILVAGDLLTAHPREKLGRAERFLEQLVQIAPVYYGNGNHEHRLKLYPENYGTLAQEYDAILKKYGVHLLVNQKVTLEEYGISICGAEIDKHYYKRFTIPEMKDDYLLGVLGRPDKDRFQILLAHDPDFFPAYEKWGADLTLSGHVHGGIVRVPFYEKNPEFRCPETPAARRRRERKAGEQESGSPLPVSGPCWRLKGMLSPNVRFFPKYDGGCFVRGRSAMIVSRGLGVHTLPFRFLNPGELIRIDFCPEESAHAD